MAQHLTVIGPLLDLERELKKSTIAVILFHSHRTPTSSEIC